MLSNTYGYITDYVDLISLFLLDITLRARKERVPHIFIVMVALALDQYWEQIIQQKILMALLGIRTSLGDVAWMAKYIIKG